MIEPLDYPYILYNEVIMYIEEKWNRRLDDTERHLLIEGYRYGRMVEAENEIKILYAD